MRSPRPLLLTSLLVALAGCSGNSVIPVGDAGHAADAGHPADAGPADAGHLVDAGPAADAGPQDGGPRDAGPEVDAGPPIDAGPYDGGTGCRPWRDPSLSRAVVVSHPFSAAGDHDTRFEVLSLSPTGTLVSTGVVFHMGEAQSGVIAFTPDGQLGMAVQADGTLGIFQLLTDGGVQVLDAGFSDGFYADVVRITDDGRHAYVLDGDTTNNGGGIYQLDIGCDGTVTSQGQLLGLNTPRSIDFLHGDPTRAVVGATSPDGGTLADAYLMSGFNGVGTVPGLVAEAPLFPDHDAISSGLAVTEDDQFALLSDDGLFAGNRVGVARITATGLVGVEVLSTSNPAGVVTSPYNNAGLVLNSDGTDGLTGLSYDPANLAQPFGLTGQLSYVGPRPQLPSEAQVLRRGPLFGRVLIGELSGVRQVQFNPDGSITDLSVHNADGDHIEDIIGAMGAQP